MVRLEWLFLMQIVIGILMLVLLQKQVQMKKQIDEITREVMQYVSYIIQDEEQEEKKEAKEMEKKETEEAQSRLIQAVLGEYFP